MKTLIAFFALAFALGTAQAQMQATSMAFNAPGPIGAIVHDAAYSAEVITTYERILPSGESIHGETDGKVYRDSQGRTRRETEGLGPAASAQRFVFIFISNPVNHSVTSLDPRTMTARVNLWPFLAAGTNWVAPKQAAPGEAERLARSTAVPSGAVGPSAASTFLASGLATSGAATSAMKTKDLGTQMMEGLAVKGTKATLVHAPVSGGNEQSMIVVTTWVSPELQVAVLTETDDAQAAHRVTKLVNIVRTEPDPALFEIPSGYTVNDNRPQKQ